MDPTRPRPLPEPDFMVFFRGWLTRQERLFDQLIYHLQANEQDESTLKELINRVMTHYSEYYRAKSRLCRQNVFLVLSPPWFSSYERAFLWIAGFKPGLAIRVVNSCGLELSPEQGARMERLAEETKDEEKELSERLASLEQQVLTPQMLVLARMGGREVNGMVHDADTAVERLAEAMELLVRCGDCLREKTVAKVVGILRAGQTVRFLAAMTELQLRIRRRGQLRDVEIRGAASFS